MTATATHDNTDAFTSSNRPTRTNRVSRRNPCRWCNATTYCLQFDNGDSGCRTVGEPDQWTDKYMGVYLHHANDATRPRSWSLRTPAPSTPAIQPADRETCDGVYARLLALCPLSEDQRVAFGLTEAQAARYGWLPGEAASQAALIADLLRTYSREQLRGVPGFREHNGHLIVRGSGLMLPTRDLDGYIVALDLRRATVKEKQARYFKLSSRTEDDADAPSPGAPAHLAVPTGGVTVDGVVGLTEGIKKADAAADALGYPVISIPGIDARRDVPALLERLAGNVVVLMLDQDDPAKKGGDVVAAVARARQAVATIAIADGYAVRVAAWDHTVAKGIDDLLATGDTFTLERYCPAADEPDTATRPAATAATGAADQELIAVQRATLADCKAQIKAWEALFTNETLPSKAQKVLVYFHQKFNTPLGRPLPEAMPCTLYASENNIKAHGLGVSAYEEGRDVLFSLGLLTRERRQKIAAATDDTGATDEAATMRRGRGRDFYYEWGLSGPAVNAFWQQLPTLTEIVPTKRQVKAVEGRKQRLAAAVAEGRATSEVVAVLKREVAREREVCATATYERVALTYERDSAREAAEAAARERDQALETAQRIIREGQQPITVTATPARIMCRAGCGSFITAAEWCCDECRERERAERSDLNLNVNLYTSSETLSLDVTNALNVKFKSDAPADTALKPCVGGCGTLTSHGWTCKPCREPLHIPDSTATTARQVSL